MKVDKNLKPTTDPYTQKSFWTTWPGVILGSIGIVLGLCLYISGDSITVVQRSEFQEIKELLMKGDYLKDRYELISDIEAQAYRQKKSRPLWHIAQHGENTSGFFTVEIEGWIKLSDKRATRDTAKIYFQKNGDQALVITKIEPLFWKYEGQENP